MPKSGRRQKLDWHSREALFIRNFGGLLNYVIIMINQYNNLPKSKQKIDQTNRLTCKEAGGTAAYEELTTSLNQEH